MIFFDCIFLEQSADIMMVVHAPFILVSQQGKDNVERGILVLPRPPPIAVISVSGPYLRIIIITAGQRGADSKSKKRPQATVHNLVCIG